MSKYAGTAPPSLIELADRISKRLGVEAATYQDGLAWFALGDYGPLPRFFLTANGLYHNPVKAVGDLHDAVVDVLRFARDRRYNVGVIQVPKEKPPR